LTPFSVNQMQNKLQPPLNPIALQQYLINFAQQQQLQRFVQAQLQYREIINRVSSLAPSLPVSSLPQESSPALTSTEAHIRTSGQKRLADTPTSYQPLEKKASIEEMPLDLRKPSIKADTKIKNEVKREASQHC